MNPCPCPDKYPDCHKECERFDYWMREQDYAGHHEPFKFQYAHNDQEGSVIGRENRPG